MRQFAHRPATNIVPLRTRSRDARKRSECAHPSAKSATKERAAHEGRAFDPTGYSRELLEMTHPRLTAAQASNWVSQQLVAAGGRITTPSAIRWRLSMSRSRRMTAPAQWCTDEGLILRACPIVVFGTCLSLFVACSSGSGSGFLLLLLLLLLCTLHRMLDLIQNSSGRSNCRRGAG